MKVVNDFNDYKLIQSSNGMKKEKWGKYTLLRPDPSIIWEDNLDESDVDAKYNRSKSGGGAWDVKKVPSAWQIKYKDLVFNSTASNFKEKFLEFCKFMLGRAFTMIIEYIGCALMFRFIPIPNIVSKCIITIIVIIMNFFISKFFAFKK